MLMTPQEYFENQRKKFCNKPYYITKKIVQKYISNIPLPSREATKSVWMSRIGKTIGMVQDEQMEQYKQMIFPYLEQKDRDLFVRCFFGLIPYATAFNAFSDWTFVDGNNLITLNDGLCHLTAVFCHLYSKASGKRHSEFLYDSFDDMVKYIQMMNVKSSSSGVFTGVVHPDRISDWLYSEKLAVACIHFIMGHELGHVERHDLETKIKSLDYQAEFAADEKGALICYGISQKESSLFDIYILAPFLALNILRIWEKRPSSTHPLAEDRLDKIEKLYREKIKLRGPIFEDVMNDVRKMNGFFEDLREEVLSRERS